MRKIKLNREYRNSLEQEYENRIHSPSTIVFDFRINEYPLFVVLTPSLHTLIVNIHKDSSRLSNLQNHALPPIAHGWYINKILVDEIKLTNDMENVHSTRQEVKEAVDRIEQSGRPHNVRFYGMALKYTSILNHSVDLLKTCADVRKLYDEFVMQEVVAEDANDTIDGQIFRSKTVYVQDSHGKIVHEGVHPESVIIESMEKALAILNDTETDALIRVAVFHYLFGYIHPFYNGNGRLSRYISSMILSNELSTLAGLRLSFVIKDHKREYDNLFKNANDRRSMGDLTDFVETFLGYIQKSLQDMIETLQSGEKTIHDFESIVYGTDYFKGHEDPIMILCLNGLFAEEALSIDELKQHAQCGRPAAQKAINLAKEVGILTQTKRSHKYLYTIRPDSLIEFGEKSILNQSSD
jgi:Fic family protein